MSIVVTGATGHLGRLVVESLLRRGVPADRIVALGRNVSRLADLEARGVVVRTADYDDPASLRTAFYGAEKLMFVSGSEAGRRTVQHRNVVTAAREAGVGLVAYTSIVKADTSSLVLAAEHLTTERELAGSGLPYVLLRNGWYLENYTGQLATYLQHGVLGAARDGRVSAAARADYAEAAAAVLTTEGHAGRVYELGGAPFTMTDLAAEVSRQSGRDVGYTDLPVEKYTEVLVGAGLPESYAAVLADADRGLAEGDLYVDGDDLRALIGREPTSLAEAVRAARPSAR
ncbi:NAD(P)H dehydrogenase (quinone) [Micromonospora pallida]|uniref:NAD(P)H dehydrogenase (Quinone) n=1 Tax=Micromonospora pallida TaxID=145854 RepID=A0A1C6TG25_9ACTN|nr:SDR family oxidoreductase [Micromonospora pallida]SCL40701.1 NAD(P)H dehydrogenase (quinone) [Micromonospora pallida]